jgi:hypothetical protein
MSGRSLPAGATRSGCHDHDPPMEEILAAIGADSARAHQRDVCDESILVVEVGGDGQQMWHRRRTGRHHRQRHHREALADRDRSALIGHTGQSVAVAFDPPGSGVLASTGADPPFLMSPVSPITRTASGSPNRPTITARRSSTTASASPVARYSSRRIASGRECPTCPANCQHVPTSTSASIPVTNAVAVRRGFDPERRLPYQAPSGASIDGGQPTLRTPRPRRRP